MDGRVRIFFLFSLLKANFICRLVGAFFPVKAVRFIRTVPLNTHITPLNPNAMV